MSYAEKERACEMAFVENGPFWHVYTDGTRMSDIFSTEEDFKLGMTLLAVCAILYPSAELVTFELMNNHIHLIMRGSREACLEFFRQFKLRLRRIFMMSIEMLLFPIQPILHITIHGAVDGCISLQLQVWPCLSLCLKWGFAKFAS